MRTIIFIASVISQPRVIKRINSLYKAGFNVKVYGFDRGVYSCNKLPEYIDFEYLGNMKDGAEYITKIQQFSKSIDYVIEQNDKAGAIFYSFSVISSYFLMKKKVAYVYELSDLLYGYPRFNLIRPLCKYIDKKVIRKSLLTVMTSSGFKKYLFSDSAEKNIIVQPNKLSQFFRDKVRPESKNIDINHIKFGFVGAIRYRETILRFAKVIGEFYPNHEFHFYGDSKVAKDFQKDTQQYSNIIFHGAFINPVDLLSIYNNIDIVVACYETGALNERIAEPNKLFESIYFTKPIIVSKNSFLENQVESMQCGYAINAYDEKSIKEYIDNIISPSVQRIQQNDATIPVSELLDDPKEIIDYLRNN